MAPILTEKQSWTRPKKAKGFGLAPSEQSNVKRALMVLRARAGSWDALAKAFGVPAATVRWHAAKRGRPAAGVALHAARMAGVTVEELLTGAWPAANACPHCGQLIPTEEQ